MKSVELDGKTYYLTEEADKIIGEFKDDMHKYKDERNVLKSEKKTLVDEKDELTRQVKLGGDKLEAVGATEDDLKNAKVKLAEANSTIDKLSDDIKKSGVNLETTMGLLKGEKITTQVTSRLKGMIHPEALDDHVAILSAKADFNDAGKLTLDGNEGIEDFLKQYVGKRPLIALDPNAKQGAGMESQNGQTGQGQKSWRELSEKEKVEATKKDPKKAAQMQEEAYFRKT